MSITRRALMSAACVGMALQVLDSAQRLLVVERFGDVVRYVGLVSLAIGLLIPIFASLGWSRPRRFHLSLAASFSRRLEGRLAESPILWNVVFAALALFLEMSVIRWTAYPRLSEYRNFGLLACFLGLGLGFISGRRRPLLVPYLLPLLGLQYLQVRLVVEVDRVARPGSGLVPDVVASVFSSPQWQFWLVVVAMIASGQLVGALLNKQNDLKGYGANLGGSVVGVVAAYMLAAAWTSPLTWMIVVSLVVLWAFPSTSTVGMAAVLAACMGLAQLVSPVEQLVVYSPYQRLTLATSGFGHTLGDGRLAINSNNVYYQSFPIVQTSRIQPGLDVEHRIPNADLDPVRTHLKGAKVLALGSGAGANVAQLLRAGVASVTAVDIDPAIVHLGFALNADGPYRDDRVRVVVEDARAFLRSSRETFDLIIFFWIDSHPGSTSSAGFRLDSFVYTRECFATCTSRVRPGGRILVYAWMPQEALLKIHRTLESVFEDPVGVFHIAPYERQWLFTIGNDIEATPGSNVVAGRLPDSAGAPILTDDWPFLYLGTPGSTLRRFLPFIVFVLALSAASLALAALSDEHRPHPGRWRMLAVFFLFGVAFMLVETICIMQVALLFGHTWQVVGIVVVAILVMAFFGNLLVQKAMVPRSHTVYVVALVCSLLAVWCVRASDVMVAVGDPNVARLLYVLLASSPVAFSSVLFSLLLDEFGQVDLALGANLLGAMGGGCLEYAAMAMGYQTLTLVIPVVYLIAMVIYWTDRRRFTVISEPTR